MGVDDRQIHAALPQRMPRRLARPLQRSRDQNLGWRNALKLHRRASVENRKLRPGGRNRRPRRTKPACADCTSPLSASTQSLGCQLRSVSTAGPQLGLETEHKIVRRQRKGLLNFKSWPPICRPVRANPTRRRHTRAPRVLRLQHLCASRGRTWFWAFWEWRRALSRFMNTLW